jgi:hypothetical protein
MKAPKRKENNIETSIYNQNRPSKRGKVLSPPAYGLKSPDSRILQMKTKKEEELKKENLIQPKLKIGKVGDKYEQEADKVADKITQKTIANLKTKSLEEENSKKQQFGIQIDPMKSDHTPMEANNTLESRLSALTGGGSLLPKSTRAHMEQAFGRDFSAVRIHTDTESVKMNQALGAKAFTHGSDIYFNSGKYDLGSNEGKWLLAHELTHIVQQNPMNSTYPKVIQRAEHDDEDSSPFKMEKFEEKIQDATEDFVEAAFDKLPYSDLMRAGIKITIVFGNNLQKEILKARQREKLFYSGAGSGPQGVQSNTDWQARGVKVTFNVIDRSVGGTLEYCLQQVPKLTSEFISEKVSETMKEGFRKALKQLFDDYADIIEEVVGDKVDDAIEDVKRVLKQKMIDSIMSLAQSQGISEIKAKRGIKEQLQLDPEASNISIPDYSLDNFIEIRKNVEAKFMLIQADKKTKTKIEKEYKKFVVYINGLIFSNDILTGERKNYYLDLDTVKNQAENAIKTLKAMRGLLLSTKKDTDITFYKEIREIKNILEKKFKVPKGQISL